MLVIDHFKTLSKRSTKFGKLRQRNLASVMGKLFRQIKVISDVFNKSAVSFSHFIYLFIRVIRDRACNMIIIKHSSSTLSRTFPRPELKNGTS